MWAKQFLLYEIIRSAYFETILLIFQWYIIIAFVTKNYDNSEINHFYRRDIEIEFDTVRLKKIYIVPIFHGTYIRW